MTKAKRGLGEVALPVTAHAGARVDELRRQMKGDAPGKTSKAGENGKEAESLGKLTVTAPRELLDRLRRASYWSRDPVVDIVRRAIEREVDRLEEKHGTKSAPQLRPGRRVRV